MSAIVVTGLSKRFGAAHALTDVSLDLPAGTLLGLVGPDGAGKTTLIRAIAGLIDPDAGRVSLLGLDPRVSAARELVGVMPQRHALYGDLTIDENLDFFGDLFAVPRATFAERRARLLALTRLVKFGDRRADALSGGMYKKLALCCALLHAPPVLLLDEPTNGVDPVSRRELWALLHELIADGTTMVVATPYMDEAERCHRVLVLDRGRVLADGDPAPWVRTYGSFESFFVKTLEAA